MRLRNLFKTRYVRLLERELFRARLALRRKERAWEQERHKYEDALGILRTGRPIHEKRESQPTPVPQGYQSPQVRRAPQSPPEEVLGADGVASLEKFRKAAGE